MILWSFGTFCPFLVRFRKKIWQPLPNKLGALSFSAFEIRKTADPLLSQGDQIGRIFAQCSIFLLWAVF
jgi:hypothetical protein